MTRLRPRAPSGSHDGAEDHRPWLDAGTWRGGGLCREVFFFGSGGHDLYGSLYAADRERPAGVGLVICGSWGMQADCSSPLTYGLALRTAGFGGAALVFHYPGYGDSHGQIESLTMGDLVQAAVDATAEARSRRPGLRWILVGLMFGAAVASLACEPAAAEGLLLVQPSLDPSGYFEEQVRRSRRATLGRDGPGTLSFGYPVPEAILDAQEDGRSAHAAVTGYRGVGALVRHESPVPSQPFAESFDVITVPGRWHSSEQDLSGLADGASDWIGRSMSTAA